jgi:hypothetical protein
MAKQSFVQINGVLYDKSTLVHQDAPGVPAILGDVPDFVSPIDGSVVSGRAGLREHCRRHDVVPTAELAGLPPKPFVNLTASPEHREQTRQTIADIINSRGYFRRK